MGAYIGYIKRNGVIKSVSYHSEGAIDELGINLNEYFKDFSDVKELVTTSIDYIDEDSVEYLDDADLEHDYEGEFEEFDNEADLIENMDTHSYYYVFKNDTWYVSKPNWNELKELEVILESEY